MEWSLAVNDMLHDDITKLNCDLMPPRWQGDVRAMRAMQDSLAQLIDVMGEQSAAAQGLNRVITTAEKLRNSPTHLLYLLKDSSAKNGQGEVIGMLKVGHKHLFLFDQRDEVREVEPLCVLDFYVVRDRQRSGYGRLLFDHMLNDMEVHAHELAIDGPSSKMEKFLAKNYGVESLMRQSNNFAVAPQFFNKFKDDISSKSGRSTPAAPAAAVGRFAAAKPHSAIANVIHGGASYYAETNNGDNSERELYSPAPLCEDERLPEPLPWAPSADHVDSPVDWDSDEGEIPDKFRMQEPEHAQPSGKRAGSPGQDEAPAAPAAFADVPAAGLRSGPAPASGEPRRDAQLTDKGYFDIKFYHNRLW